MRSAYAAVLIAVLCVGGIAASVYTRDTANPGSGSDGVASAEPQAQARLVADFSAFAGSDSNARSLVRGLRQGGEINLAAGGRAGPATQFTPPTRPMDFGNVRIALVLAREQLAQFGITRPNPAQLKAVLVGGGVASRTNERVATPVLLPGVLQMRAGGMGWQPIASSMGITLAQVMNGSEQREDSAALPQDPIASASITTSSAGAPRDLPTIKPIVAFPRSTRVDPGPENLRTRGNVLAAAVDGPPRGDTTTETAPARTRVEAAGITATAMPAALGGPAEESQEAD
jgi:hypothetical protein